MNVVRLGSMSIIGFLLMSRRIAAVVVHEDSLPPESETIKERMVRISPGTKFLVVVRDEQRTLSDLAGLVTA